MDIKKVKHIYDLLDKKLSPFDKMMDVENYGDQLYKIACDALSLIKEIILEEEKWIALKASEKESENGKI